MDLHKFIKESFKMENFFVGAFKILSKNWIK